MSGRAVEAELKSVKSVLRGEADFSEECFPVYILRIAEDECAVLKICNPEQLEDISLDHIYDVFYQNEDRSCCRRLKITSRYRSEAGSICEICFLSPEKEVQQKIF